MEGLQVDVVVVMGRFPFDRAVCWMAWFVGERALAMVDMGCMWPWCAKLACTAGWKGFRLTWFVVMGRFPFDRAAAAEGCWMAWLVGGRALGRHGLRVAVVC